jgi:hypothetical protein
MLPKLPEAGEITSAVPVPVIGTLKVPDEVWMERFPLTAPASSV